MKRIAKYETNDGHLFDTREEAAFLTPICDIQYIVSLGQIQRA